MAPPPSLMDIQAINKRLKDLHGVDDEFRPIYRIVWSDSQIEKRFGTFSEMYGPIFLREVKGMQEVPKYSYIKHRWVLEKLMFAMTDEVIGLDLNNRCYEPIYTFEDKFGQALPVEWWAVEMIVGRLLGKKEKKTQADCDREEQQEYDKEVAYSSDYIANVQGGDIATKLSAREGIVVP